MADYSYDQIQYESHPYSQTHPEHLYTLGRLFHLNPPHYASARILELGCASGGNIIPMAYAMPEAHIVGIDLSGKQIENGLAVIHDLGLTNITLKHTSITDVDATYGIFDYIICHGVYSWVPDAVQDKILKVCNDNLSEQGIAYISYNTLPGWNVVKSFRDMMRYHVQHFDSPDEKAAQARSILQFMLEALDESTSPYAQFLKTEYELLSERSDSYLLHDHLSEMNQPVYFHQFIEAAEKHGLMYLADTPVTNMYTYNLPPGTAAKLIEIPDIVQTGQYMDFLRNQRFRCTLLCRRNSCEDIVKRNLNINDIEKFYLSLSGTICGYEENPDDFMKEGEEISYNCDGLTLTISDTPSKAALKILHENKHWPLSFDELCDKALALPGFADRETGVRHLKENLNLMRLMLAGLITISSGRGHYTLDTYEKPRASALARYQSRARTVVTNQRHDYVNLDMMERTIIQYLDGTHSIEEVTEKLNGHFERNEFEFVNDGGEKCDDTVQVRNKIEQITRDAVKKFFTNALILPPDSSII
jgi:methyltransferase-like protein/2-polyprenyl-3-methyl-5-hydroxy-6-metoxy-1,4-benzoquinol methylase